jgi:hypothetical protein
VHARLSYVCNCGGWGSSTQNKTCPANVGFENVSSHFGSRGCRQGEAQYECWSANTAKKVCTATSGLWYSTTSAGYGVTWKVAEVVKRVSKACSDSAINEAVERAGFASGCFQKCGAHATGPTRNTSDVCWISCFEETVSIQCCCRRTVAGQGLTDCACYLGTWASRWHSRRRRGWDGAQ